MMVPCSHADPGEAIIRAAYSDPFHVAVCLGQADLVRQILASSSVDVNASIVHDDHGHHTPVDMAIIHGRVSPVSSLPFRCVEQL